MSEGVRAGGCYKQKMDRVFSLVQAVGSVHLDSQQHSYMSLWHDAPSSKLEEEGGKKEGGERGRRNDGGWRGEEEGGGGERREKGGRRRREDKGRGGRGRRWEGGGGKSMINRFMSNV